MYTAIATLGLSFLLTVFSVDVSEAALWVCSQPDGSTLFTDVPQTGGSCQKHEPVSQLNYAPARIWPDMPPPDVTYEKQAVNVPDAQWESRSDEQEAAPSDVSGGYSPEQSNFLGHDQNPVFTFYSYTPRFYGVPYLRHKYARGFPHKPQRQHEIPHISSPFNSTQTPSTHFRDHSIRPIAPQALPHSVPPTSSTHIHMAPGLHSKHSPENSVRTVGPGAPPRSALPPSSTHVRESSVAAVASAGPPQSSLPTSSAHFREHSGEPGIQGAPSQSLGFRQDLRR